VACPGRESASRLSHPFDGGQRPLETVARAIADSRLDETAEQTRQAVASRHVQHDKIDTLAGRRRVTHHGADFECRVEVVTGVELLHGYDVKQPAPAPGPVDDYVIDAEDRLEPELRQRPVEEVACEAQPRSRRVAAKELREQVERALAEFEIASPGRQSRKASTSAAGNWNPAKSANRGGSLSLLVRMNLPPDPSRSTS
jgi:hypothetical protein